MAELYLRFYEDQYAASDDLVYLPALNRAVYVVEGSAWLETAEFACRLEQGSGWVEPGAMTVSVNAAATRMWRWELGGVDSEPHSIRSAPRVTSRCLLEEKVSLPDGYRWLMRCDRVAIPAGKIAYTHVHQGPGIRCTSHGSFRVDTLGAAHAHGPGDAWFETGIDAVTAFADPEVDSDFVRCLLLPSACKGRSSVRYVKDDDMSKPKPQSYTVFAERLISLPA